MVATMNSSMMSGYGKAMGRANIDAVTVKELPMALVSVLQCVAVCCSVLQCVAVCCSVLQWNIDAVTAKELPMALVSVLQCVAVCRDGIWMPSLSKICSLLW